MIPRLTGEARFILWLGAISFTSIVLIALRLYDRELADHVVDGLILLLAGLLFKIVWDAGKGRRPGAPAPPAEEDQEGEEKK